MREYGFFDALIDELAEESLRELEALLALIELEYLLPLSELDLLLALNELT